MKIHRCCIAAFWFAAIFAGGFPPPSAQAASSPAIQNVQVLTPSLAVFDRFEAQFDLSTVATNLDIPYDPAPPPGQPAGTGVSVDALFSPDNWQTTIVQPAFLYQPFSYSEIGGDDHLVPAGAPRWSVRFTPQSAGNWQLRLRATDAGGSSNPNAQTWSFTVSGASSNPYARRGSVRVQPERPALFRVPGWNPLYRRWL